MKNIIKIAVVVLIILTACNENIDQIESMARYRVEKDYNAKALGAHPDSCYSITPRANELYGKIFQADSKARLNNAFYHLEKLQKQLDFRKEDRGGDLVPCYVVSYTCPGTDRIDSTVVMLINGEYITDKKERDEYFKAYNYAISRKNDTWFY